MTMVSETLYETVQTWAMWTRRWAVMHGQEIGVHIDPGRVKQPILYTDIAVEKHGDYLINLGDEVGIKVVIDSATKMGGRPKLVAIFSKEEPFTLNEPSLKVWMGSELEELIPRHHEEEE